MIAHVILISGESAAGVAELAAGFEERDHSFLLALSPVRLRSSLMAPRPLQLLRKSLAQPEISNRFGR